MPQRWRGRDGHNPWNQVRNAARGLEAAQPGGVIGIKAAQRATVRLGIGRQKRTVTGRANQLATSAW